MPKLANAITLYSGDFLTNVTVDSPDLDGWLLIQREQLRRQALDILDTLPQHYQWLADFDSSTNTDDNTVIDYAQQQIEPDPLRESACRQLMMALARSGRAQEALAQYDICKGHEVHEELHKCQHSRAPRKSYWMVTRRSRPRLGRS